jgi:PIN domain nuclease of toxin-antitoxin system
MATATIFEAKTNLSRLLKQVQAGETVICDPFDRILAAHALALDIPIVGLDPRLDQFGIRRLW